LFARIVTVSPTDIRLLLSDDVLNFPITAEEFAHVQEVDEEPVKLKSFEQSQLLSEMPARSVSALNIIVTEAPLSLNRQEDRSGAGSGSYTEIMYTEVDSVEYSTELPPVTLRARTNVADDVKDAADKMKLP
jgi:hypothetical protein